MISTKFKRFIAVLLCVVVLASFSLSAFASYSTLAYENINSIQESFVASFLSHCGIEVEFFNWDLDYSGSEFKNAAWCNLTRNFLNYIDNNDSKMSNKILDYASSCGIDSSIHGSSFVWDGSFKDCREIVNQLIYHLYNYLSSYENVYGFVDVPLSMYIGDDEEKYTGCYSRVDFSGAISLSDWYTNIGQSIQSYCIGDYVADDFEECYINYYWDYGKLPLGYGLYIDVIDDYIDDYNSSSGDSSDTSSDIPDLPDVPDVPSEDVDSELLGFVYEFYRPFFLGLLSTFDIDICRSDFDFEDYNSESALLKSSLIPIVDDLFSKIMGESYSYYISYYYPNIREDFLSVCSNEWEFFSSPVYAFYPFDDYGGGCSRRFYLGFFELFCSEYLDSRYFAKTDGLSIPRDHLYYGDSRLLFMFSLSVVDVPDELAGTYTYWKDYWYYNQFVEFLILCPISIIPIPIYKDIDDYFDSWVFNGYNFWYPYLDSFNFDNYRLYFYDGYNIKHLLEKILILGSSENYDFSYYLTNFFTNAKSTFSFLSESFSLLPIQLQVCFTGGFIIVFAFAVIKLLL